MSAGALSGGAMSAGAVSGGATSGGAPLGEPPGRLPCHLEETQRAGLAGGGVNHADK
jgi:hypothetical protein